MKWTKSPNALVQLFDHSLPIAEGVERRAMFGYPCAFFKGHLFCGLHRDGIIVLVSEARRDALVKEGASLFEAMQGKGMKQYVVVPPEIVADRRRLRALLSDALAHASSLAPKPHKPSTAKKKAPPKRKASARKTAPAKKARAARKTAPAKKARAARKTVPAKKAPARRTTPAEKARARKAAPAKRKSARKASRKKRRAR